MDRDKSREYCIDSKANAAKVRPVKAQVPPHIDTVIWRTGERAL